MWQRGCTDLQKTWALDDRGEKRKKNKDAEDIIIITINCLVCSFSWSIAPAKLLYNNRSDPERSN